MIEPVSPDRRLRICVVGDLEGPHTLSWLAYFVRRGHDMHAVSYYVPARPPEGVQVHALRPAAGGAAPLAGGARPRVGARIAGSLPSGVQRLANLLRYRRAGLRKTIESIAPDVLHAHYLVEHGLYGTSANRHPYIVSAWGSDVLVEPEQSRLNRAIARFVVSRADFVTANNRHMLREIVLKLGADRARAQLIVLGVSQEFLDLPGESVNALPGGNRAPVVLSTRSLDSPLYNIDTIIRAMSSVRVRIPHVRLVVAGSGRLRPQLEGLAKELEVDSTFLGYMSQDELHRTLLDAEVFVSVPSSDATSVALLQAMAAGSFPIVSHLPSQQELVDQSQGLRVLPRDPEALAAAITSVLEDPERRRNAIQRNRRFVEDYGLLETNMERMENWYYRLAGRMIDVEGARPPNSGGVHS